MPRWEGFEAARTREALEDEQDDSDWLWDSEANRWWQAQHQGGEDARWRNDRWTDIGHHPREWDYDYQDLEHGPYVQETIPNVEFFDCYIDFHNVIDDMDVNHWFATATAIGIAVQFDKLWVLSYANKEWRRNNTMQWLEDSATLEQLTGVIFTESRKDSDRNWRQLRQAPGYKRAVFTVNDRVTRQPVERTCWVWTGGKDSAIRDGCERSMSGARPILVDNKWETLSAVKEMIPNLIAVEILLPDRHGRQATSQRQPLWDTYTAYCPQDAWNVLRRCSRDFLHNAGMHTAVLGSAVILQGGEGHIGIYCGVMLACAGISLICAVVGLVTKVMSIMRLQPARSCLDVVGDTEAEMTGKAKKGRKNNKGGDSSMHGNFPDM
jgi:hypothetical protein